MIPQSESLAKSEDWFGRLQHALSRLDADTMEVKLTQYPQTVFDYAAGFIAGSDP